MAFIIFLSHFSCPLLQATFCFALSFFRLFDRILFHLHLLVYLSCNLFSVSIILVFGYVPNGTREYKCSIICMSNKKLLILILKPPLQHIFDNDLNKKMIHSEVHAADGLVLLVLSKIHHLFQSVTRLFHSVYQRSLSYHRRGKRNFPYFQVETTNMLERYFITHLL